MRIKLKPALMLASVCIAVFSLQAYMSHIVIPENARISTGLMEVLGREFVRTGKFPTKQMLGKPDIGSDHGLPIKNNVLSEQFKNRWGQEIRVLSVNVGDINGRQLLELTVFSNGPFGCFGNVSKTDSFEFNPPKQLDLPQIRE